MLLPVVIVDIIISIISNLLEAMVVLLEGFIIINVLLIIIQSLIYFFFLYFLILIVLIHFLIFLFLVLILLFLDLLISIFFLDPGLTLLTVPLLNGIQFLLGLILEFLGALWMYPATIRALIIPIALNIQVTDDCALALTVQSSLLSISQDHTLGQVLP